MWTIIILIVLQTIQVGNEFTISYKITLSQWYLRSVIFTIDDFSNLYFNRRGIMFNERDTHRYWLSWNSERVVGWFLCILIWLMILLQEKLMKIDGHSCSPIGTRFSMRATLWNNFQNGDNLSNKILHI